MVRLATPAPAPATPAIGTTASALALLASIKAAATAPAPAPTATAPATVANATLKALDALTIAYVAPANPKKPGSATHGRWGNYAVGRTLAEVKRLGTTAADIRWDLARGLIKVG